MKTLWYEYDGELDHVDVELDGNVSHLKMALKERLQLTQPSIYISLYVNGSKLSPQLLITDLVKMPEFEDVKQAISVRMPHHLQASQTTLWRVSGTIKGGRKMGFRRGLYSGVGDRLGYYETRIGVRVDPFCYDNRRDSSPLRSGTDGRPEENDEELDEPNDEDNLVVNVIFKSERDAARFILDVRKSVVAVSPFDQLTLNISMENVSDVVVGGLIFPDDYKPDENSAPDTPRHLSLSVVTELFDSSPLFAYQRLEDEKWFGLMYKADRAHLIDKKVCVKTKQYFKLKDDENNFIALSKEVHCWFDAIFNVSENIPFFNLKIKHIDDKSDPENACRYRVTLTIEAYNAETARLFFMRLKKGSRILDDTTAETFVYVLNPKLFKECLDWKADKINKVWNMPPAVD